MIPSNPKKIDRSKYTKLICCPQNEGECTSVATYQNTGATKNGLFRYLTINPDGLYFNEAQDGYGYKDRLCLFKLFTKSKFITGTTTN